MNQILEYLVKEQNIAEKKKNGLLRKIKAPAPILPPAKAIALIEPIDASSFQFSNRGLQRGQGLRGNRG